MDASLVLLTGLHSRWSYLLGTLSAKDLNRDYIHPELRETTTIAEAIGMYAWHCRHHLTHISSSKVSN